MQLKNNGPAYARNCGVKTAKGSFIVFADDDIIVPFDWLESFGNILSDSNTAAVGGKVKNMVDSVYSEAYNDVLLYLLDKYNKEKVYFLLTNNLACRKQVFEDVGGFDERLTIGSEDREFITRLTTSGYNVKYAPEIEIEHYHGFSLWSFFRHHFRFGQASHLFYSVINIDNMYNLKPDTFKNYFQLFTYTFKRKKDFSRYTRVSAIFLSQLFFFSGFFYSSLTGIKNLRAKRSGFKMNKDKDDE